ncbi:hypothetical protein RhiirA1_428976 [Rhizophagus irregularis]|uniref:Uncharacterized protein n=3 Tax=Rhizophagus irregularis TaxID=588596 RepID=U9SKX5_RHIID|nr:hypothetical protein GLOIN_2v1561930 [Rhizophagus irregularis DAOM 181602=DAOM 197198]EXX57193.1 hypothetical protein RirG_209430 [Rhizophagus irregularis DAOM 197198w]PKC56699.1 hypothetical protein RhiirA1_428976 [Rhizophagus irregularis]POG75730.1 hypothetical protein GLOIN_2v1561930 [Rhizophagus irregularis DAOM 181602=DAOM 197198]|eukprot:XP_025182596.1 hypothetical protein GLOIN_2v1561930 [Rhizophagus irregularis DAOM 181602=DAOM 197198]
MPNIVPQCDRLMIEIRFDVSQHIARILSQNLVKKNSKEVIKSFSDDNNSNSFAKEQTSEISFTSGKENHVTEISETGESEVNALSTSVSNSFSEKLPDIKMSTSITSQTNVQYTSSISSSKSRLPISILPEDPEEKQKHIIGLVLEQFPYLSLSDSDERDDRFNLNSSVICPICNRDHKETICKNIKGEWSSGEYCRERTYRLKCWNDLRGWNPNSECEISIEAKFRVMHSDYIIIYK